jgi:hypothetical protein
MLCKVSFKSTLEKGDRNVIKILNLLPFILIYRYNYKINDVFREVMGVSGMSGCSGAGIELSQSSRHKSKCNIL